MNATKGTGRNTVFTVNVEPISYIHHIPSAILIFIRTFLAIFAIAINDSYPNEKPADGQKTKMD
jgi:hypothetical protein